MGIRNNKSWHSMPWPRAGVMESGLSTYCSHLGGIIVSGPRALYTSVVVARVSDYRIREARRKAQGPPGHRATGQAIK